MLIEHFFQCPKCWQEISVLIDTSVVEDEYIEDCEVCCNPIEFTIKIQEGEFVEIIPCSIEQ